MLFSRACWNKSPSPPSPDLRRFRVLKFSREVLLDVKGWSRRRRRRRRQKIWSRVSAVGTTPSSVPLSAYKTIAAGTTILGRGGREEGRGEGGFFSPPKDHYYLSFGNKLPARSFFPLFSAHLSADPSHPSLSSPFRPPLPSPVINSEKYSR